MTKQQKTLWVILALAAVLGSIGSEFPRQMYLQHFPTVVVLIALPIAARRIPLSNIAFACIVAFMLLHVVGARYIYSYVPYDAWSQSLFHFSVNQRFGFVAITTIASFILPSAHSLRGRFGKC